MERFMRTRRGVSYGGLICLLLGTSFTSGRLPAQVAPSQVAPSVSVAQARRLFEEPPDDARIMMRWWWFGSAVTKPELKREILAMKAGGIGGFEIQPVYPLALDDPAKGFRNLPYLSPEFLDAVSFAATTAREEKMRVDMTLASGWPYGGSHVNVTQASARIRMVATDIPPSLTSIAFPDTANGESLMAVLTGDGSVATYDPAALRLVPADNHGLRLSFPTSSRQRVALFFILSRTGQQVKRPAVDADGFVLDHFDKAAVETHLDTVGETLMKAFGDHPPYAVFSDSLEVYGADWTGDLLAEFRKRRGYDLAPHLPQLFKGTSEESLAVRHDWGETLTELINERYLGPIDRWAKEHHTLFRSQTYGDPAVSMSSNSLVALPEGEGPQWRQFSYTRWASSASHLYGRPVTSAETWTWLHSPAFRATPLDMKAEADLFFLEGVNQLIGHGWPYSPPDLKEPGWAFYAAAVFNDHNPWWTVMPDIAKYLQRVSSLLRQGDSANDVAVLLPNDDAYAKFKPGKVSLSDEMGQYITPALTEQILNSGYGFDYVDAESIERLGVHQPILVLPHVERLSLTVLAKITEYAEHGGKVIAVGSTPMRAPGLVDAEKISARVRDLSSALFLGTHPLGRTVKVDEEVGESLKAALTPDVVVTSHPEAIGFIHRRLADADIYFVVNTANRNIHTGAMFRSKWKSASIWDPFSGVMSAASSPSLLLDFAPYESKVIVLSGTKSGASGPAVPPERVLLSTLSTSWKVSFPQLSIERDDSSLTSWDTDDATRYFSGEARYEKDIELTAGQLKTGQVILDFGEGTPVEADSKRQHGTSALLESPVREAAIVFVNGERVGSLWHPPYVVDLSSQLHAGKNHLEIRVANLAINELAGRSLPDYRLLNARYGQRFIPQDVENLQPLPSGILGPVKLFSVAGPR
jgi:hypothetical protein